MQVDGVKPPIRVNTRLSSDTNDWLDRKAYEMGLTKSALINLAVENFRNQTEVAHSMPDIVKRLEQAGISVQ